MHKHNNEITHGFPDKKGIEVAIIGAGVSGLYSAYRLLSSGESIDKACEIQIFEMSHRIGGRLESIVLPGMKISAELGGMRYTTSQKIVTGLIEDVFANELTNIQFPMGNNDNLFGYFRKHRVKMQDWNIAQKEGKKLKTKYDLNKNDIGLSAEQLFNKIVYSVLKKDPWFVDKYASKIFHVSEYDHGFKLTRKEWNDIKPNLTYHFDGPYKGKKVNNMGFWNLIKDQTSEEGYNFLSVAGGYYSNTINWNAAEAFPYMVGDFSDAEVQYKTIEGGYDKIAYALANAYLKNPGASIWGGNRLVTFSKSENNDYRYELVFFNEDEQKEYRILANKIIMAMPTRSLELLDQNNFFFARNTQKELQKNIDSVVKESSFKILMGFEEPWWKKDFGIVSGHSRTDLPIRQCYYFGIDPNDSHSLFLGSYNDMRTTMFWNVLGSEDLYEPKTTKLVSLAQLDDYKSVQASKVMVHEVMNQIREMHGRNDIPEPYITYYKNWSEDPYGAGYHAWRVGVDVAATMKYMRRPHQAEDIFICGEAYSDQQGWVEGAFCVAEKMLQDYFNLQQPTWLNSSYYLGW